jgi:8-oxo-dGTP pyrophosphatase MutT (NUDIX family)
MQATNLTPGSGIPYVGGETIELPAGLIDGAEPPERAALRELKEETGYVGTIVGDNAVTPAMPLSPGLSNETVQLVRVGLGTFHREE